MLGCLPQSLSSLFFEKVSSMSWNLPFLLDWLASEPLGFTCLCPSIRITGTHIHALLLCRCFGIWTHTCVLVWYAFYPLSNLPNPVITEFSFSLRFIFPLCLRSHIFLTIGRYALAIVLWLLHYTFKCFPKSLISFLVNNQENAITYTLQMWKWKLSDFWFSPYPHFIDVFFPWVY